MGSIVSAVLLREIFIYRLNRTQSVEMDFEFDGVDWQTRVLETTIARVPIQRRVMLWS